MANELRKTIGRSMRYVNMNEQIKNKIKELEKQADFDLNAQTQIYVLKQQLENNLQHINEPMTTEEYKEYDDNGEYIGKQSQTSQQNSATPNSGLNQTIIDGINHLAQGVSLGWSDEINGVIGGVGRVLANGIMRAAGQNVNGESFSDAWKNGYTEYRDFARQELNNGSIRNKNTSIGAEILGSVYSPIRPLAGMSGAVANGVIGGVGMTDDNTLPEYAINIGLNTAGNLIGEKLSGRLGDKIRNLSFGTANLAKPARVITKAGSSGFTNQLNQWRKDGE